MMNLLSVIAILIFLGAIVLVLKRGFNEIVKGLESVDARLKNIEDKLNIK